MQSFSEANHDRRRPVDEYFAAMTRSVDSFAAAGLSASATVHPPLRGAPISSATSSSKRRNLRVLLRAAQARRLELEAQTAAAREIVAPAVGRDLEQRLRVKIADWLALLRRNVDSGRDALRALLAEPLRFTPDRRRQAARVQV